MVLQIRNFGNGMSSFVPALVIFIEDGEMCVNLLISSCFCRIVTVVSYKVIFSAL
jgi:hypothetical protein